MSYVPGAEVDGAREFVVTLARRDIVAEYEGACQDAGLHAGRGGSGDVQPGQRGARGRRAARRATALLVNLAPDYLTVVDPARTGS